jgi:lipopolysaccharide transport system permease protein
MKSRLPGEPGAFGYSIYLCAGVLTWGLFSEITTRAQNVFLENANLMKKLSFPRLCLPVTVVANSLLNFGIVFGLFALFLVLSGNFPGPPFLAMAPLILVLVLFSVGLGITLGVLNVFFRDVGQFFGIFVTFWFWLTPIVYPASILPEEMRPLMSLNPMAGFMAACQGILLHGQWPRWADVWPIALLALVFCALGLRLFRSRVGEMVDEI